MSKPPGNRVRNLHILCTKCRVPRYEPVEDAQVYTVVAPEYLVSGGDGYAVIGEEMIKHNSGEMSGSGREGGSGRSFIAVLLGSQEIWTFPSCPGTSANAGWCSQPSKVASASPAPLPDRVGAQHRFYWERCCCSGPAEPASTVYHVTEPEVQQRIVGKCT